MPHALGRRPPTDWRHVEKYPLRIAAAEVAERILKLPAYRSFYVQPDGSCVGFSSSWMMSILNRRRYAAHWLYEQAQLIDEWGDTPPEEGTSVRAGMDILRTRGHRVVKRGAIGPESVSEGISTNRWAASVDDVRSCIADGTPVTLGVNWYSNFDHPVRKRDGYWIGEGALGSIRGGHAICAFGVSDRRQAVRLVNSWGTGYPLVWVGYATLGRLINEDGEVTVVTDRP